MPPDRNPQDLLPLPSATLHILVALLHGEKHGYAIMGDVERLSDGAVRMGPGRLTGLGPHRSTLSRTGVAMTGDRRVERHQAAYRALLVLYPRPFRAEFGEPMVQLFGDRVREVGARAWLRTIPDLLRTAPSQRVEAVMNRNRSGSVDAIAIVLLIAFGAIVVAVGLGGAATPLLALALVAVAVSQRHRFTSTPADEQVTTRQALTQAWWAPLASFLGLVMIVGGAGTYVWGSNPSGRLVGGTLLIAVGVAMLAGLFRRPVARQSGNTLILLATVPAFLLFWLVVPALVAVAVWVGVLRDGFDDRPSPSTAS